VALETLRLADGDATVTLAPALGGAIASFTAGGRDVLRPTPSDALAAGNVRATACYPLVPYSNRIADASLRLPDGTRHALARNFGDHPHSIHGVGWQRAWHVASVEPTRALLCLEHRPDGENARAWPFAFRATQSFALRVDGNRATLGISLAIESCDARPFPFGLGWHPFFPRDEATRLGFRAAGVWLVDGTNLPTRLDAAVGRWRFDPPRTLADVTLDNAFTGWDGRATLVTPSAGDAVTIEADRALGFLVVYAPAGRDFLAVEPVTHMTDAFNRATLGAAGTGTRVLAPGAAYSCTMRITCAHPSRIRSP
jgi:aldose 1-epimerase